MKKPVFPETKPKYKLGDRLYFNPKLKGFLYGWRYQDEEMTDKPGWYCLMRWDNRLSVQGVHEDSLHYCCPNCDNKWNKLGCETCGLSEADVVSDYVH